MREIQFESVREAEETLVQDHAISQSVADELFESVCEASESLISKYSLEQEVDREIVREFLKIGFCENILLFLNEGLLEDDEDVRELIGRVRSDPVANATTVSGRVATRHKDLMRLSKAILADKQRSVD
jgi:hypothetical protein